MPIVIHKRHHHQCLHYREGWGGCVLRQQPALGTPVPLQQHRPGRQQQPHHSQQAGLLHQLWGLQIILMMGDISSIEITISVLGC